VRDLTVLSDHRVVLFPNLSQMHLRSDSFVKEISDDSLPVSKIQLIDEFMSKYRIYDYSKIDEELLFDNLSYFVKCSSGNVSLSRKVEDSHFGKFRLAERSLFLSFLDGDYQ
jgi:hypothetical protein